MLVNTKQFTGDYNQLYRVIQSFSNYNKKNVGDLKADCKQNTKCSPESGSRLVEADHRSRGWKGKGQGEGKAKVQGQRQRKEQQSKIRQTTDGQQNATHGGTRVTLRVIAGREKRTKKEQRMRVKPKTKNKVVNSCSQSTPQSFSQKWLRRERFWTGDD